MAQILQSAAQLTSLPRGAVISVGNFDGVHRGHQAVLAAVAAAARSRTVPAVAVTFEPHPLRLLRPDAAPRLITPLARKLRLLAETGVDAIAVLPFTRELSELTARAFVETILVRGLAPAAIHEGANFQFGHRHAGNVETLAELGREFGFQVVVHPEMRWRGERVSSSHIRRHIAAGAVSRAARLLGRWFSIAGPVSAGAGVGRRLTVPTLNLADYSELLPARGVYVTQTRIGDQWLGSVTNCGLRPTFTGDNPDPAPFRVETHLLEVDPTNPPETPAEIEVRFLHRLRDEQRFPSPKALKVQILADVTRARRFLRRLPAACRV